jgi:hypothetical protein
MGVWHAQAFNEKTLQACTVTRVVRYCMLCRLEFHEGEDVQQQVSLAVGLRPTLTPVALPPPTPLRGRSVLREEMPAEEAEGEGDNRPS